MASKKKSKKKGTTEVTFDEQTIRYVALFQELNRAGLTVVIVTHEADVAAYAARVAALRAAGHETTLLYGVDDLDAMDAQALLTPDAIERSMGVPLAHIPDQAGDGHASYARHHAIWCDHIDLLQ